jgi:tRNA G18 (ribose-2'-O)-methylase SpoU
MGLKYNYSEIGLSVYLCSMEKLRTSQLNRIAPEAFEKAEKIPVVIVLDNIRSALNVGSIFRTADAFALEGLVLCGITRQPPHREILKTALGSTETVIWDYQTSTRSAVEELQRKKVVVYAVEQTAVKTWLQQWRPKSDQPMALVFGNEVEGVSDDVLELCDGVLEIPQFGTKHSLNVAVAAGIVCWEVCRWLKFYQEPA